VTTVKGWIVSYLLFSGSLGKWWALTVLFHPSWSDGWNVLLRTKSIKGIIGIRWIRGHQWHYVTRNGWYCTSQLLKKPRWWYQHEYFIPLRFNFDPWAVWVRDPLPLSSGISGSFHHPRLWAPTVSNWCTFLTHLGIRTTLLSSSYKWGTEGQSDCYTNS